MVLHLAHCGPISFQELELKTEWKTGSRESKAMGLGSPGPGAATGTKHLSAPHVSCSVFGQLSAQPLACTGKLQLPSPDLDRQGKRGSKLQVDKTSPQEMGQDEDAAAPRRLIVTRIASRNLVHCVLGAVHYSTRATLPGDCR